MEAVHHAIRCGAAAQHFYDKEVAPRHGTPAMKAFADNGSHYT